NKADKQVKELWSQCDGGPVPLKRAIADIDHEWAKSIYRRGFWRHGGKNSTRKIPASWKDPGGYACLSWGQLKLPTRRHE
ncbi:MAG TPA: hypothetical protein VFR18_25695, partial [Terriglobia bacterium]|nr:hypothetical protein [Terriglobia bacterium]